MIAVGVESNCMRFNGREREGVNQPEVVLSIYVTRSGKTDHFALFPVFR